MPATRRRRQTDTGLRGQVRPMPAIRRRRRVPDPANLAGTSDGLTHLAGLHPTI